MRRRASCGGVGWGGVGLGVGVEAGGASAHDLALAQRCVNSGEGAAHLWAIVAVPMFGLNSSPCGCRCTGDPLPTNPLSPFLPPHGLAPCLRRLAPHHACVLFGIATRCCKMRTHPPARSLARCLPAHPARLACHLYKQQRLLRNGSREGLFPGMLSE